MHLRNMLSELEYPISEDQDVYFSRVNSMENEHAQNTFRISKSKTMKKNVTFNTPVPGMPRKFSRRPESEISDLSLLDSKYSGNGPKRNFQLTEKKINTKGYFGQSMKTGSQ